MQRFASALAELRVPRIVPIVLALLLAGCGSVAPTTFGGSIDELLQQGSAYARSLADRPAEALTDEEVVVLGYLERQRLGVGSPFRLVAFARRDPRLSPAAAEQLSYAILNETVRGRGYRIDPAVLDVLQLMGAEGRRGFGEYHLALIERTVADAPTALAGERAVRLGYMLAGTERSVDAATDPIVAYVAAMVADRRRARSDATELLRTASSRQVDPLELLDEWRGDFRFTVEGPAMGAVSPAEETAEAQRGARVASSLRVLAQRLSAPSAQTRMYRPTSLWRDSWLRPGVADRLEALAAEADYPAQPPIAVAVAINRQALLSRAGLSPLERERRDRFAQESVNEERVTAAAATLARTDAGRGPRLPLILLQASVFMRGWSQEEPWFPGDPAPSGRDLENRFGIAGVTFDRDVPESWRPYYRRMLGRAFADLQRVLPTASLRGLSVRVGSTGDNGAALALHDPRSRTLILPPHTGAGTIAHEVAHDLDWQLARARYGRRGSYATDLAVNRRTGDRVASSLVGLAAAFARESDEPAATDHDKRPAELFARGMDWLIAAQLAGEGRSGGYLTSFQDVALAGYGTTRGPQVDGSAVPSLLTILDQVAPVPGDMKQWATDTYGPTRTLTAKELVRAITSSAREGTPFARFDALDAARGRALAGLGASSCEMKPSADARRTIAARRAVIGDAVASSARGIIVDGVRSVARELPDAPSREAVDGFLLWRLDGGPEPADSAVHVLIPVADEMLLRAARLAEEPALTAGGFRFDPERTICGGNPFASGASERRGTSALFPRRAP